MIIEGKKMANGYLQNILGTAEAVRGYGERAAAAPLQMEAQKQQLMMGRQKAQQALEELRNSKRMQTLLTYDSLPDEQKPAFVMDTVREMQMRGEDTTGMDKIINMPLPQQKAFVKATIDAAQRMGQLEPEGGTATAPSAVREYQFFQTLTPEEKETFLKIKRSTPSAKLVEVGGRKGVMDAGGNVQYLTTVEEETKAAAGMEAATTEAAETTKAEIKREESAPARQAAAQKTIAEIDTMMRKIGQAQEGATPLSTGLGSYSAFIRGTPAFVLNEDLETIRNNLSNQALMQMRLSSPTGGGVGQVTEREWTRLGTLVASLAQGLPDDVLKRNLEEIYGYIDKWRKSVINARGQDLMKDGMTQQEALQQIRREFGSGQ